MSRTPVAIPTDRDRGAVLPLVLVFSVALALVVGALATYASATLRLGQSAERASDRLASASGAMDSALEDLERGVGPCLLFGQDYTLTDTVNDLTPEIDCNWVGGRFDIGDLFAVVMTGEGTEHGRAGPLLTVTNGGTSKNAEKIFEGPVYMAATPTTGGTDPSMDFRATLSLKNADLLYSMSECESVTPSLPPLLSIIPVGYGTQCYEEGWDAADMFGGYTPAEPGINATAFPEGPTTPPPADAFGCHVWPAGEYDTPPQLGNRSYNYFASGDYYFKDMGSWDISSAFVLFGYPGEDGPSIDGFKKSDTLANNPCAQAWADDTGAKPEARLSGATIYMGGSSRMTVNENSTLEISGRERSGQNIAVQALEQPGGNRIPSTVLGEQRIVSTGPGSNKQLSIQGLVWAPYAALEFDLISNDAVAALTGGAVVSELVAGASANANNFLIRVDTDPDVRFLNLTTTATSPDGRGSTSVRAVVRVQRDEGATSYAVESRRVVGLTPEGPPAATTTTTVDPGTTTTTVDPGTTTTTVDPGTTTTTTTPPVTTVPGGSAPGNCVVADPGGWNRDFGPGGWTAEFWNLSSSDPNPSSPLSSSSPSLPSPDVTTTVTNIDLCDPASPASGVNDDHFAARFSKTFNLAEPETITLLAGGDDGYRVWIDGNSVINNWSTHSHQWRTGTISLDAGDHTVVFEFFEQDGEASYQLWRN